MMKKLLHINSLISMAHNTKGRKNERKRVYETPIDGCK